MVNAPLSANPAAATGLSRFTADQAVFGTSLPTVVSFRNFARTNGTSLTIGEDIDPYQRPFANLPALPRRGFIVSPDASRLAYRPTVAQAKWEQKFGPVFSEAVAFRGSSPRKGAQMNATTSYIDVNRVLPDGGANPNFGKSFSEIQPKEGEWICLFQGYRLAAAYPLQWRFGQQLFSASLERANDDFQPREYSWAVTKSPTNSAISPA